MYMRKFAFVGKGILVFGKNRFCSKIVIRKIFMFFKAINLNDKPLTFYDVIVINQVISQSTLLLLKVLLDPVNPTLVHQESTMILSEKSVERCY